MFINDKNITENPPETFRKIRVPQKPKNLITDKTLFVVAPGKKYKISKSGKRWTEREGLARSKTGIFDGKGVGSY